MPDSQPTALSASISRYLPRRFRSDVPVVPIVRLEGVIESNGRFSRSLSIERVEDAFDRAFANRRAKAVAIVINSPGGSPAQSHLIYERIRKLAVEEELPVLAFVEDAAASGGYMIACAADEIICNRFSIIGSIGVVGTSFGFQEAIKRLGIERRIYTAGDRKVQLDPFVAEDPEAVERIKALQKDIHAGFIDLVKYRRDKKLFGDPAVLFSGDFWTAPKAFEMGLIDGIGDIRTTLRERFGEEVLMPEIDIGGRGLIRRWIGLGSRMDASAVPDAALSSIQHRLTWSRLGL